VGIIKSILTKAKEAKEDPYKALLAYRTTPFQGMASPMELLNNRVMSTMPMSTARKNIPRYKNGIDISMRTQPKAQVQNQLKVPDQLQPGTPIMVRDTLRKIWDQGYIVSYDTDSKSYMVDIKGSLYKRSRQHIKIRNEPKLPTLDEEPSTSYQIPQKRSIIPPDPIHYEDGITVH